MARAFIAGLLAGYGIAIPLGVIAVLIVATASRSFPLGASAGLGAATADLAYATLAVVAGTAVRSALAGATRPIHLLGGAVLAGVAVRGLLAARRERAGAQGTQCVSMRLTYARFLALTLLNPLTAVYFASLVLGGAVVADAAAGIPFVVGVALASASWQILLAGAGAFIGSGTLNGTRLPAAVIGNGIVLALAAKLIVTA